MRGFGGVYKRTGTKYWWIRYSIHGEPQYESSKSTKKSDAKRLLKKRLQEAERYAEAPKRMTMADALRDYADDVELRELRSAKQIKRCCLRVQERIGSMLLREATTKALRSLQKQLRDDGYSPASTNQYVTTAGAALKLAVTNGYIVGTPVMPKQLK